MIGPECLRPDDGSPSTKRFSYTVRMLNVLPVPLPRQGELCLAKKNFQKSEKTS
jgi:hypothetical protein